jgi:hypothetical protein
MATPSTRTPIRLARGTYSNLNNSIADLQEGEIVYATDQNNLYVKEGSSLILVTTGLLDEDNMATNSATQAASQQSIKAYVDASSGGSVADDSLAEVKLDISNAPSDGYFLQYKDSTDQLTWAVPTDTLPLTTEQVQDIVGAMFTGNTETNIAATYEDSDGTIDLVADNDNTQLTTEQVQDIVGAMVDGGTETRIGVTYDDTSGKLDFVVDDQSTDATKMPLAGGTFTGAVEFEDKVTQDVTAVGALEIDCSAGNYFTKAISGNSTFTFANVPTSGNVYGMVVEVDVTGSSTSITWPAAVKWPSDTAPTLTDTKTHVFSFVTVDAGTTWRGSSAVDYVT